MSRIVINVAVVSVFVFLGVAGGILLWGGRGGNLSYVEMACSMDGKSPDCMEGNFLWKEGLHFFDSTLSVTNDTVETLRTLLWNYWGIEFAGAENASSSQEVIFPLSVLKTKKSGCVGLSWLALMVAESRQLDLHAILLPGHVFLQYGSRSSANPLNLEPNRKGYSYSDEEYRRKYQAGPWTGLEFKPLLARQLIGLAAFDAGNLYLEEDASMALKWYRIAEEFFPEYPGISANQKIAKER